MFISKWTGTQIDYYIGMIANGSFQVVRYPNYGSFPSSGELNKLYLAEDTMLTYRWDGNQYIELGREETIANKVSSIDGNVSDIKYPNTRAVFDHVKQEHDARILSEEEIARAIRLLEKAIDDKLAILG